MQLSKCTTTEEKCEQNTTSLYSLCFCVFTNCFVHFSQNNAHSLNTDWKSSYENHKHDSKCFKLPIACIVRRKLSFSRCLYRYSLESIFRTFVSLLYIDAFFPVSRYFLQRFSQNHFFTVLFHFLLYLLLAGTYSTIIHLTKVNWMY